MAVAVARSNLGVVLVFVSWLSIPKGCLSCCQGNFDQQTALFAFGDSFFDPGNNNYINTTTDFQANQWPYGESYFDPPTGRFSDGRLIPDFIAEYANLPLIPAYLEPTKKEYTYGANFASGGAGALIDTHAGFVVNLQSQLRYFGDLETRYRQNLGDIKAQQLLSSAVYLLSCGTNDYISHGSNDLSMFHLYMTHEQYVDMVIGNLTYVIKEIYKKGGRKFGLVTVPLVGCWASIRMAQPDYNCNKEKDDIIRLHNQALARKLEDLEEELEGFMYATFDMSTSISKRMKNPSQYGLKDGERACCGGGPYREIYSCGGMREIKEYQVCDNASEYLFFDSFHPTQVAYRQFADMFWNGDSTVTQPYNLKTLFNFKGIEVIEELPTSLPLKLIIRTMNIYL